MKYNKRIRIEFSELLLHLLLNRFEGEQLIRTYVGDIFSLKHNIYNEKLLCKIIRNGSIQEIFNFEFPKIQNEFLAYLIEEKWSFEILEAIHFYLTSLIENEDEIFVKQNFKIYHDIRKGLVNIYQNDSLNPKNLVLVAKILTILCTYDESGNSVESLINLEIISAIARKISTYDYSLLQTNILLLYVLTDKIKSLKMTEQVAEDKLLFNSFNHVITNSKFYDAPMFIFDNLIKILFNLIASDVGKIQQKIQEQIEINSLNNVPYNLLTEFLTHRLNFKDDYRTFLKRCKIEEKVYRFYSCLIKKNDAMKNYFKNDMNFLKVLSEKEIFRDIDQAFSTYSYIFTQNKLNAKKGTKHPDSEMLGDFVEFLRVIFRLFQFVFFLYSNEKNELQDIINNQDYIKDFLKLFEIINLEEKEEGIIKNELAAVENLRGPSSKEFKEFGSTIFSLGTLVSSGEDEAEDDDEDS